MPNVTHTSSITGRAMAVLAGVVCLIGPWFVPIGIFAKIGISVVGIILIYLGAR